MKNLKKHIISILVIGIFVVLAVGSAAEKEVVATNTSGWIQGSNNSAGWVTVPISERITYGLAWEDVSSLISRQFEIEMISKETGYIRTQWQNNWVSNGEVVKDYRVRVTIKMSELRKKVEINSEAEKYINGVWVRGTDTELLQTLKRDIAGLVGS